MGPLRRSSNSANLTTYKEGDERGQVWVEVLRNVQRTATGWDGPAFFSVRVNRQYGGQIGRFTYEPDTEPRGGARPGELSERTVTRLVRRYLNEREEPDLPVAVRAAEDRRAFRELIESSSLGTPGAVALRKAGRGEPLTSEEQRAADAEIAEQARPRRRSR